MLTIQRRKSLMGRLVVPALAASFLAYFALHAQSGKYGLEGRAELARELEQRESEYAALAKQRERLEKRVQLLHDGTLERDMIDERAREALNLAMPDEIIILR
ncbi:FtsB family cell division protein [Mangrovicella endophytica]|uniref:FtsB family cell division protein n=1 Tax=Mangrovicella endophytica TaxID=2066697 RepID=UPI000C9EB83E|nr:septum formation initiator family protein [Mangrovicella endophytica]